MGDVVEPEKQGSPRVELDSVNGLGVSGAGYRRDELGKCRERIVERQLELESILMWKLSEVQTNWNLRVTPASGS